MHQWAERDVVAAGEWLGTLEEGSLRNEALTALAMSWANRDPEQAAAWVANMPVEARMAALPMVTQKWLIRDGQAARAWISQLPDAGQWGW